ncbi:MAG TPA: tRNA lysidine(34) synthetase TilS [Elusimicrobiota bacterium]|nr:tRNA lysidine(34) synthetase TilS [Elusimicrobiota bacterium]
MRKEAFAARVWSKMRSLEKERGFLAGDGRILAAISGGPDSVCLGHYLWSQSRRRGFALFFVHFHHGLRGRAADADARFVLSLGKKWGVPTRVIPIAVAAAAARRRLGLEEAGRKLRYQALAREAKRLGCGKAATAHHLDDQAESVLLSLLRGSRLEGLAGIFPERPLSSGVELIRPLLSLKKSEIREYLRFHGLKFRVDRTNASRRFTRNWVRQDVLPLLERKNPRVRERLASIADQVRHKLLSAKAPAPPRPRSKARAGSRYPKV